MEVITVGRSPENDIVLEDKKVSAKHLALSRNESGETFVQDLGSTNGTLVNGKPIGAEPHLIFPEDQILIGDTLLPWFDYFAAKAHWKNKETILDQEAVPSGIFDSVPNPLEPSDTSQSQDALQKLKAARRKQDDQQKNRILWISLMILLILFLGLLLIWYFSFVVSPELTHQSFAGKISIFKKMVTISPVCF